MADVKQIIEEITSKKEIKNLSFAGCGGSLACFYAPFYYVQRNSKKLTTSYVTSNEFVHDTPITIDEHSIVVCASRRGNTAETVEAARVAKKLGATTIGLALEQDTDLEHTCDYLIPFVDSKNGKFIETKAGIALAIAYELVHITDAPANYEDMVKAMAKLDEIMPKALVDVVPEAIKFSLEYKDDDIIYTMGSGVAWSAAQQQQICIFMEMQWINSSVIHTGEFFHGPFEITDPDNAFLVMKSSGKTKELDERAIRFLTKFNHHCHIIDLEKYGVSELGEVSEYFDAIFHTELIGVYNKLLADMRDHPLSKRKYMWKYQY